MTQIPLKDAVRQHVQQTRLTDAQYEALRQQLEQGTTPQPTSKPLHMAYIAMAAAVLLLAAALGLLLQPGAHSTPEAIAAEVTRNHIKLKPLEVRSDRMDDIRAFFVELDFTPIDSAVVASAGLDLEGGRYCSVQGVAAAQLRVRNPSTGGVRSVYMVPYTKETFGVMPQADQGDAPLVLHARGLQVQIWVERGVLLAMTGDP